MQRVSAESPPRPPVPRGSLSPAPDEGPEPPPTPPLPPLPPLLSALYRSAFAQDCEAIALQLQAARKDSGPLRWPEPPPPPPSSWLRRASTIEAETLTPLGPSWSFLDEAFRTPARGLRAPEEEEEEGEGEQAPPGLSSGRWQPPRNRTYDGGGGEASGRSFSSRPPSLADSHATYLCDDRSRLSAVSFAAGARSSSSLDDEAALCLRTFGWELPAAGEDDPAPLVTSTPLLLPAAGQRTEPAAKSNASPLADAQRPARGPTPRSAAKGKAGRPKPGSGGRTQRGSVPGTSVQWRKLVAPPKKGLPATRKKSLAPGASPAKMSLRGAAAAAALPILGKDTKGKILQGAGTDPPSACLRRTGMPGARARCTGQSQTLTEKQLPDEMKKTQTKLPCYKKPPMSIPPPSKPTRGPVAGGSLTCLSLEQHGVSGQKKAPGMRLPVHTAAGDNRIAKAGAQKRPQEKPTDTVSTQKHPFLKWAYQSKGQTEKPTSGVLLAAGQICRTTPGTRSAASCLECPRLLKENQRLFEENQQLKITLDKYRNKEWQKEIEDVDNSKL